MRLKSRHAMPSINHMWVQLSNVPKCIRECTRASPVTCLRCGYHTSLNKASVGTSHHVLITRYPNNSAAYQGPSKNVGEQARLHASGAYTVHVQAQLAWACHAKCKVWLKLGSMLRCNSEHGRASVVTCPRCVYRTS